MDIVPLLSLVLVGVHMGNPVQDRRGVPPGDNIGERKGDSKLLAKCVEELKRKGLEFDLMKEVDALRRAKSLQVESKPVRKWSGRDFVTLFFCTGSCSVLGLTRVILCG
ncbi:hypothetical protein PHJA_000400700 [Phtheirospermum japonicum]|uniref:Uncharacterized protein n=1 Tax=Phtheirospermum japonicum TaxID=374723 RepID=A0A830B689_9LAMI|nr:hypothetical protein PHJA_000400700 [Phtheirospermum japonicum]